jgi:hypothetical protein
MEGGGRQRRDYGRRLSRSIESPWRGRSKERIRSPRRTTSRGKMSQRIGRHSTSLKRFVQLDSTKVAIGKIRDVFHRDINTFNKEMDPSKNYKEQREEAKRRLEDRIFNEWKIYREGSRISEKWLKYEVGKCLINNKFALGKLILAGKPKPPEVPEQHWKDSVDKKKNLSWLEKSKSMTAIARKRGIRNNTKAKVEKAISLCLERNCVLTQFVNSWHINYDVLIICWNGW